MTIEQCYNHFHQQLLSLYDERESANITDWIFENVTWLKRWERNIQKNTELSAIQISTLNKYLEELMRHKPLQYILEEAWFYKSKFFVNENVLIPRPETEELVSWVVSNIRELSNGGQVQELKILDIGTGSGCIAISIKKNIPGSLLVAVDVSKDALSVATRNAIALQADVDFLQIDFLNENCWNSFEVFDIIVSNPPYIPDLQKNQIAKNVTAFEPAIALFVEDNDPFIFYKAIAKFAQLQLNPNGKIFVEIHEDFAGEVSHVFQERNWKTEIKKDIYGKDRFIKANR
jgi:release factor glutamine methyltransferase